MRRLVPVLLAALLLVALAGPVAAARPEGKGPVDVPVGSYDFVITSDIGCAGFDVLVEDIAGRITEITAGDRLISQFRTISRYTRLDSSGARTDASFEREFHSLGVLTFHPDGSLMTITGSNDALVWGPDTVPLGLDDGIWLIDHGRVIVHYDTAGNVVGGTLYSGATIDVCDALS
jgi:hypothetical protein